jgi:hypothetical protein
VIVSAHNQVIVRDFDPTSREAKGYSNKLLVARRRDCGSDSCDTQVMGLAYVTEPTNYMKLSKKINRRSR